MDVKRKSLAFTLVELLAVIAVLAVLAVLMLPALAATKPNSRAFQCMNNHRQIVAAWRMYADENNDYLPPNDFYAGSGSPPQLYDITRGNWNWVGGSIDVVGAFSSNNQATNDNLLVQAAALGPYNRKAGTYKCPSDQSIILGQQLSRNRSVSMNAAVGTKWNTVTSGPRGADAVGGTWLQGTWGGNSPSQYWRTYGKLSSIVRPRPDGLFIVTDEHPNSIGDPVFLVSSGIPDANGNPTDEVIIDTPGSFHNGACTFSFADEHVEMHRWIGSDIKKPMIFNLDSTTPKALNYMASSSLGDLRWIQSRTTAVK